MRTFRQVSLDEHHMSPIFRGPAVRGHETLTLSTFHTLRASTAVIALTVAIGGSSLRAQEATTAVNAKSGQLPTIIVTQPSKASTKAGKPTAKAKPVAESPAPQPPPIDTANASPADAEGTTPFETTIGVGTRGLAIPLSTTSISSEAIAPKLPSTSDAAELLRSVPGVSIYGSGGVSGLPVINGLNDDRVKIVVNGGEITSACPNHMNPPLSYIDPTQVAVADVMSGITPVSKGGDSLGGTVVVESPIPAFARADESLLASGSLSAYYRSINNRVGVAGRASAATENVSVGYAGAWTKAGNYDRGDQGDPVLSTLYEAQNHALTFAVKNGKDLLVIEGALESIPYQGFVNQRMDMVENEGRLLNARYAGHFDWGILDARAFYHDTKHRMDILADKKPGEMPMWVDGSDAGYSLKAEIPVTASDVVRIGNEFHHQSLDDRWPPVPGSMMMGPDFYKNINDGTRDRLGTFAEWEHKWDQAWTTLFGVRNDMVWMNTGDVQAYSSADCLMWMGMMCMMPNPDAAAARAFNAKEHDRQDANFDLTALVRYQPTTISTFELGYARKTRSPNLYERYSWGVGNMAADMVGWYGDANGYIGDMDLNPEVAHTVSLTAAWHGDQRRGWEIKVTPYYTFVEDYIDADFVKNQTNMMGMPTGFVTMRFANHDARLYGVNVSGSMAIWNDDTAGRFELAGVLGYVNGENLDTGDTLYHMMPFNARLALTHRLGGWSNAVELQLVDDKSDVNALRHEPTTPGYALVNLRTSYEWQNMRLDLGIENLFDKLYYPPLGGVDYAGYKAGGGMGPIGPVPGEGRSFNAGLTVKF